LKKISLTQSIKLIFIFKTCNFHIIFLIELTEHDAYENHLF